MTLLNTTVSQKISHGSNAKIWIVPWTGC